MPVELDTEGDDVVVGKGLRDFFLVSESGGVAVSSNRPWTKG
jgi:hypothetical protein